MIPRTELDAQAFAEQFALADALRHKHILITGARGLIGRTLVRCLAELNSAHGLNLVLHCPPHQELEAWLNDATLRADYIVHLACPTASADMVQHPVEVMNAIVQPTQALLEYARHTGASMVYVSSMEVYGQVLTDEVIDETYQGYVNPLAVRSSYPMGKRMAEALCHSYAAEYGVDAKIARLVQTFGAGIAATDNRVFAQFARSVMSGQDIVLKTSGRSSRKYLYLTDAVSALLYILLRGEKGEAYNAAHPDSYISIIDMAHMLQREFNPAIQVRVEIDPLAPYPPDTHLNLSTARLEHLGWRAQVPLRDMFSNLIDSLKQ
ncbi:MAG: NAD-dependent epimerase/dehydratase family protein [Bacteroidales bacterium]|nr:NAD-dependent epimerase/dehydratase family protein [Bacteroidales bacterium]